MNVTMIKIKINNIFYIYYNRGYDQTCPSKEHRIIFRIEHGANKIKGNGFRR